MSGVRGKIEAVMPEELLAFEARYPRHSPAKDQAVRHQLGIAPARYYQLLLRAADSADGIAAHPLTARRVREIAEVRARQRERRTRIVA